MTTRGEDLWQQEEETYDSKRRRLMTTRGGDLWHQEEKIDKLLAYVLILL